MLYFASVLWTLLLGSCEDLSWVRIYHTFCMSHMQNRQPMSVRWTLDGDECWFWVQGWTAKRVYALRSTTYTQFLTYSRYGGQG
ncbi:uncharacterized protein FA14DRAFT_87398 [Meira miltonrushii]|uniref:Secreted protein n=1 Tax=Meira miltonrushii TaxID=1280837 RepID=A0A316V453_9BASI|nr:uncharacterized protein FA14DRAFT_87398 [Meira miltonrushii]PWN32327.1 hypothetical protein FA14DRAFT_87398 [Meira miltonrushii]